MTDGRGVESVSYRYKPSKPMAVLGIEVGAAMIVLALTSFDADVKNYWFVWLWRTGVVAIAGMNAWAAFSDKGSLGTYIRVPDEEDRPRVGVRWTSSSQERRRVVPDH